MSKKDKPAAEQDLDDMEQQSADEQVMVEDGESETWANGKETPANGGETPETDELTELREQVGELKDKYMRMYAEFENYKRRAVREKLDWMKSAAQDTMSALLPVLDDFDRAKKFAQNENESGLSDGVELVYQKLYNTLKQRGLEEMESTGEAFDPELHDAITEIPAPTEDMKGKVVDTIEKGYRLNDKIIRHAKVVVGK